MKIKSFFSKYTWSIPVGVGFVLRLFDLTRSSIWHDEGYTMWLIRYNPVEIIERTARDVHPPAYYLIAKLWTAVFGSSVFSIRFLSLIFSLGIIFLLYKIIELIWNKRAAFWASLLVAASPFMIRFGQEARMYGVVAFFVILATYFFVKYIKEKNPKYLYFFVPSMLIAMYTQYYSFFAIISLWLILALYTPGFFTFKWREAFKQPAGIFSWEWWLTNATLAILYLPWFYVAYKQVTRVSDSYWIQPAWINARTIPSNVSQFLTYSHMDVIYNWNGFLGAGLYWVIAIILIGSGLLIFLDKSKRKLGLAFYVFGYLPMILVFIISKLRTPIYQDRYFPFAAVAIFAIWGSVIALINNRKTRVATGVVALSVMLLGIVVMRESVNHQMKQLTDTVISLEKPGDEVVSGSLYTFLDSSYYFGYGNIKFLSDSVDGYGETSLFYDQANEYMIQPATLGSGSDRVWLIGRVGENYTENTPLESWTVEKTIEKGSVKATLYTR